MSARRGRDDAGSVLVEAALALPLVMIMVLALFDFSIIENKYSTFSSAARDGARAAIVNHATTTTGPQTSCSAADAAFQAICGAVTARLAGDRVTSVEVRCYLGTGRTATPVSCASPDVKPDTSTVEVIVTWQRKPVTFIGQTFVGDRTETTTARMVVAG